MCDVTEVWYVAWVGLSIMHFKFLSRNTIHVPIILIHVLNCHYNSISCSITKNASISWEDCKLYKQSENLTLAVELQSTQNSLSTQVLTKTKPTNETLLTQDKWKSRIEEIVAQWSQGWRQNWRSMSLKYI